MSWNEDESRNVRYFRVEMLKKASSGLANEFAIERLKLNRGTMKIVQDSTIAKRHIPNWLVV
jgi:hypothetical protein